MKRSQAAQVYPDSLCTAISKDFEMEEVAQDMFQPEVPSPTAQLDAGNKTLYAKAPVDDAKTLSFTSGDDEGSAGQEDQQTAFVIPFHLFSAENWSSLREPATIDDSSNGQSGEIAKGSIGYLKGAARVLQHEEVRERCNPEASVIYLLGGFTAEHQPGFKAGCPFSDESLQSKKLLVNFNHKGARTSKGSPWQHRLKNSLESCSVVDELSSSVPNVEQFLHRLELGDEVLESNLLSVVEAKSDDWMPRENACIMEILNEISPEKGQGALISQSELEGAKSTLDQSALNLQLQEVDYDEKCLAAYLSKLDSYKLRLHHQKNEWVQKQMERAKTSVHKWFDSKVTAICWPEKIDGATAINAMQQLEDTVGKWTQSLQLRTPAYLFVANFVAPSLVKSELTPCILRSMVYFVLLQVQDALWTDARDQRPMAYSGKFIGPLVTSLDTQKVEWLWKDPAINRLRLQDDPPAEHLESPPEPPALKRCTYGKVEGQIVTLEIPEAVVKQYGSKEEFKTFHEGFLLRNPPTKTFKTNKKGAGNNPIQSAPVQKKRLREEDLSSCLVDVDEKLTPEGDSILVEVPIINARAGKKLDTMPVLRISTRVGAYIVNQSGHEVTLQKSSVLCGFGKAKFKEGGNNETLDTDTEIPFEVNDGTYAVLDNQFGTIGEHLSKAKQTQPNNHQVRYHKSTQDPDGKWQIEKEHAVIFCIQAEDDKNKVSQSQVGQFLKPPHAWNSKAVKLGWQLKWSLNGMQPSRAVVFVVQDVTIPDQKAFLVQ
ncbi:unnamed protein product [Cladocopium goreaui]|uniref:Uncharacterized protein n=1 Tax=Cladocopium goreaui TaxID=2562237 RepID=A0A9P1DPH8_9DINO|nr:unnamed protein product [Cladocopium goreaui]